MIRVKNPEPWWAQEEWPQMTIRDQCLLTQVARISTQTLRTSQLTTPIVQMAVWYSQITLILLTCPRRIWLDWWTCQMETWALMTLRRFLPNQKCPSQSVRSLDTRLWRMWLTSKDRMLQWEGTIRFHQKIRSHFRQLSGVVLLII